MLKPRHDQNHVEQLKANWYTVHLGDISIGNLFVYVEVSWVFNWNSQFFASKNHMLLKNYWSHTCHTYWILMKYLKRTTWDISATFHHFQYLYYTIFPKQLHTVQTILAKKKGDEKTRKCTDGTWTPRIDGASPELISSACSKSWRSWHGTTFNGGKYVEVVVPSTKHRSS